MLAVLSVTFPFFALVLCGYVATQRRMLPIEAIPGLNGFVLYFALPCLLFRFGANTPIAQLLNIPLLLAWLFCALATVAFAIGISLNRRIRWNDAAFGALVAAFPNTGFMGVPLLVALLGPAAAGPAIVTIVVDLVITSSLCIALSRLDGAGAHGVAEAGRRALAGVAVNPMPWSIALGAWVSATGLALPQPLLATLGLLADAASPAALFTIGAVLARSQMRVADGSVQRLRTVDWLPITLVKLVVHPALVLLVLVSGAQLGLSIDRFAIVVVVLVAALPSASNVSLLAERFGADTGRIARIILATTAAAFFTFSAAVALLI